MKRRFHLIAAATLAVAAWPAPARAAEPVALVPGAHTTVITDATGRSLAQLRGTEPRVPVPLVGIPHALKVAVIAIEDARFYSHPGIDLIGTARALVADLRHGGKVEGGSTITQQLARNLYLSSTKTWKRKIDEAVDALELERRYSKDQILEMYLNRVYWGHGAYGCQAAAETYFGKPVAALSLPEAALLAGLLTGPEIYTPYRRPDLARHRQHLVLDRMAELGYITPAQAAAAKAAPLVLAGAPGEHFDAQYFTANLIAQLSAKYGTAAVQQGGLRVTSTVDLRTQRLAEKAVERLIARSGKRFRFDQAALVAIDPRDGAIRALVGGSSFERTQFDRAIAAHRQPGSTFKPFVYLTAFSQGLLPEATASDAPVTFRYGGGRSYTPHNFEGERLGVGTLRQALETSNDVIAVKLEAQLGLPAVMATARALGLTDPLRPDLTLALGSSEVTPLELCSAYATIANGGKRVEPTWVRKVVGPDGRVLDQPAAVGHQVVDPVAVARLTDVLQGVIARGTGTAAACGRPAAGKTGTSSGPRDVWFAGYTPQLACVIWAGNDDDRPMRGSATGGTVVAPTWGWFMRKALAHQPELPFAAPPPSITFVETPGRPATGTVVASPSSSASGSIGAPPAGQVPATGATVPSPFPTVAPAPAGTVPMIQAAPGR